MDSAKTKMVEEESLFWGKKLYWQSENININKNLTKLNHTVITGIESILFY